MTRRSLAATADQLVVGTPYPTLAEGVTRYDAELLPAGGEFLGEFRFFRAGQDVRIAFTDGTWDGTRLEFTSDPLPGFAQAGADGLW